MPESGNHEDRYAVAVINDTQVVGHVPRKISFVCHLFLRNLGMMVCKITGPRQYSADLHQGGLEVPCLYQFYSDSEERLIKVQKLLEKASYATKMVIIDTKHFLRKEVTNSAPTADHHEVLMVDTTETESTKDKIEESAKKTNIDTSKVDGKKEWLRVGGIKLTINDRNSIMRGEKLNDMIINAAQKLLKSRFPKIKGLNSTLLQAKRNLNACAFEEN